MLCLSGFELYSRWVPLRVESELNSICQWACFKKKTVIIVGDLNLDRLRLDCSEGKILRELEEVNGLHCLINEPTRVTANSQTLIECT